MTLQLTLDMSQRWLFGNAEVSSDRGRRSGLPTTKLPRFQIPKEVPNEVLVFAGCGDGAAILSSVHLPVCSRNGPDAVLPPSSVDAVQVIRSFRHSASPRKGSTTLRARLRRGLDGDPSCAVARSGPRPPPSGARERKTENGKRESSDHQRIPEEGWPQPDGNCGGCDVRRRKRPGAL